jgi:hypothetical protein
LPDEITKTLQRFFYICDTYSGKNSVIKDRFRGFFTSEEEKILIDMDLKFDIPAVRDKFYKCNLELWERLVDIDRKIVYDIFNKGVDRIDENLILTGKYFNIFKIYWELNGDRDLLKKIFQNLSYVKHERIETLLLYLHKYIIIYPEILEIVVQPFLTEENLSLFPLLHEKVLCFLNDDLVYNVIADIVRYKLNSNRSYFRKVLEMIERYIDISDIYIQLLLYANKYEFFFLIKDSKYPIPKDNVKAVRYLIANNNIGIALRLIIEGYKHDIKPEEFPYEKFEKLPNCYNCVNNYDSDSGGD